MDTKRCSRCCNTYPVSNFSRDKSNSDGIASRCRNCDRIYTRRRNAMKRGQIISEESRKEWKPSFTMTFD